MLHFYGCSLRDSLRFFLHILKSYFPTSHDVIWQKDAYSPHTATQQQLMTACWIAWHIATTCDSVSKVKGYQGTRGRGKHEKKGVGPFFPQFLSSHASGSLKQNTLAVLMLTVCCWVGVGCAYYSSLKSLVVDKKTKKNAQPWVPGVVKRWSEGRVPDVRLVVKTLQSVIRCCQRHNTSSTNDNYGGQLRVLLSPFAIPQPETEYALEHTHGHKGTNVSKGIRPEASHPTHLPVTHSR